MKLDLTYPVFLVGLMGAGKTTLGKIAAEQLGLPFLDTDEEVVKRSGADIPWIFDVEGEAGFREREAAVLEELVHSEPAIISTGGGIVVSELNRQHLNQAQCVVYLDAEPEKLFARIGKDKRRPLLQTSNPLDRLRELHAQRDPLYKEVATAILTSGNNSPKEMGRRLAHLISEQASF